MSSCWFCTRGLHLQRALPGSGCLWDGCSACLLLPASSGRGLVSPGSTELTVTRPRLPAGGPGQGLGQVSSPRGRIHPAGAAEAAPEAPPRGQQKCFQATPQGWRMEEHEKQPGTWSKPGPAGALGQGAVRLQGGTGRGEATSRWGLRALALELGPMLLWGRLCGSRSRAGARGRPQPCCSACCLGSLKNCWEATLGVSLVMLELHGFSGVQTEANFLKINMGASLRSAATALNFYRRPLPSPLNSDVMK